MTFVLGDKSQEILEPVDPRMKSLVEATILQTPQDFSVTSGLRTARQQAILFQRKASKLSGKPGHKSRHQVQSNGFPWAVDLVPYLSGVGLRWEWPLIYPIAATMARLAREMSIDIRWGGVWDRELEDFIGNLTEPEDIAQKIKNEVYDYTVRHPGPDFIDGPHYELKHE